jgi:superfamily I DNA/RNA helicase
VDINWTQTIRKGIITSDDALFMACTILYFHHEIARVITRRFPYIIVDEAQDDSFHQHCFFKLLKNNGLQNLEMVGDPCQSIYRFRSAMPELFAGYMKSDKWQTLHFSECRRSNQRIIDFYDKLRPTTIPKIRSTGVIDKNIPIIIYKYDDNNRPAVMRDFRKTCENNKLKDTAIIARGDAMCRKIAGVQQTDLKYWKSQLPYWIIGAVLRESEGDFSKAFGNIRKVLCKLYYGDNQYEERRQFLSTIEHDLAWNKRILLFISKRPSLSLSFTEWTHQCTALLKDYWELDHDVDFEQHHRIKNYKMSTLSLEPVEKYYSSADKSSTYRNVANTIHSLKGASLDAVLLFLSKDSIGQNLSINDFPSNSIPDVSSMSEKQNMLYVACSRAKQFLAIAVPSSVDDNMINRKFQGLDIWIKEPKL